MKPGARAAIIAGGYVAIAGAWIVLSSRIARSIAGSVEELERIERFKGIAFVVVTGLGLLAISFLVLRRQLAASDEAARARELLLKSERTALAGLFVSSIAHDASNLAMVVTTALDLVKLEKHLDPGTRESLGDARESMGTLIRLFKELKEMGRDRSSSTKVVTDVRALVERSVALLRGHSLMKHCDVRVDAPASVSVPVFPVLIDQVLINLLLNAADATDGHGHIEVRLHADAGEALLEVHDDGKGVPDEQVPQLFSAFSTTKPHGTGLGLVSVKECALAHGGRVGYARSPLGGANFTVGLPILPPASRAG
jgi:two-component system sensor histidine kinase HydH